MAVYIVEDDPGVSDSLSFLLEALGHLVFCYADAETFLVANPPRGEDTVIVDLGLPGISGAQAIRFLHTLDQPPKVICITGQPQRAIDESLRGLRAPVVLRKPLTDEKLVALL